MIRPVHKVLALAVALLLFPLTASSQIAQSGSDPLAGQAVERFDVVGNTSVASDTIRVYLGISPGDIYNPALIQQNFRNLWQTGLFDDIRVEAERGQTGVVLKVIVKERPRIGAVEYRGNKNLNASKIGEALEKDKIDIHVGNTIEQTLVHRASESIQKAYAEAGYEGVTVNATTESMTTPGEQKIVFVINEGIKAKVARIDFEGNKRFSDRRLRAAMKDVKKHNIYTWIRKKDIYTPSKLDDDIDKIKDFYKDYGYQNIEIGEPKITTIRAGRKPRVKIDIPVKEGEVHSFGEVSVSGNSVFTADQLIGQWPLKKGETLRRKPIQSRIDLFDELYHRRGYIYAYIDPDYTEKENNVVDVHLKVFEGDQFRLGRLEFEGNTTTKDKVLRREIFLDEGDIMDMETFKSSMYKLGQLGYFKVTENPDFKVNPEQKTVDVTVKGQEEGKNELQFGGGFNESTGFFGSFSFSTRNLLGEGESLGVNIQAGVNANLFTLSYADPWFLDKPNSFGVSIFKRRLDYPTFAGGYQSGSTGGNIAYGFRIGRFESLSFLYGLENNDIHQEVASLPDENGNVPLPIITDQKFVTSAISPSYRYDSRDNPYDTARGTHISLSAGIEGGPLGGNIDLIKPIVNFSHFKPITRRSSFSFNVEAGKIFPYGKDDDCVENFADLNGADRLKNNDRLCVPQIERFYVGGYQSVRGFEFYSIGPKETVNGQTQVVGGHKYNVLNLEYIYRINDPLRLVFFADAGNAYGLHEKWDPTDLRYSAGAELRIFLPVFQFPLRFIYAQNLDPRPDDRFSGFSFSVGNTF